MDDDIIQKLYSLKDKYYSLIIQLGEDYKKTTDDDVSRAIKMRLAAYKDMLTDIEDILERNPKC